MSSLSVEGVIWDGKSGKGLKAKLKFSRNRPRCHNCSNKAKRMCVEITKYFNYSGQKTISLCTECLQKLVDGVNQAVTQHRVLRTVLTGMGAGDAVGCISKEEQVASADELRKCFEGLLEKKE